MTERASEVCDVERRPRASWAHTYACGEGGTKRARVQYSMGGIVSGNYLRDTSSHFAVCAPHQAILSFARHIKQTGAILRHSKLPSTLH